jgi:thiol-disulfide isomerase/thioredoxin
MYYGVSTESKLHLKMKRLQAITLLAAGMLGLAASAWGAGFDLTDTAGTRHRLADYKGRPVVLNYWATWCVPCIQEIPEIAAFHKAHPEVIVIGIAIDADDVPKTKAFATKVGHTYPLVLSNDNVEKQLSPVKGLPTTRIFDASGKLVYDKLGRVTKKSLEEATGTSGRAKP